MSDHDTSDAKLSILHITTHLHGRGGIEETLRVLCSRLDPARYRIGLCSLQGRHGEITPELLATGVETFGLGRRGWFFDPTTSLALRRLILDFGADIVHTHRNKPNLHGRLAARLAPGVAIVTTHHDMGDAIFAQTPALRERQPKRLPPGQCVERSSWVNSVLYPRLNVSLNRLNDKVIGVSGIVRQVYTSDPDDGRFAAIHAPYDERLFRPRSTVMPDGPVTIGTVGRLAWQKGHGVLLEAFASLLQTHPGTRLKIVGDGPLRADLRRRADDLGLSDTIELSGEKPHSAQLYDGIDLYVQPSLTEGCSITILEAMGLGLPVVATAVDGPRELIEADRSGILVPPQDPVALRQALLALLTDRARARELGAAASNRALTQFSGEVFTRKMAALYDDVAAKRSRAG